MSAPDQENPDGPGPEPSPRHEVEDMKLPTGVREEPREIVQALQITQRHGVVLERNGPVVAFSSKDPGVLPAAADRRGSSADGG